MFRFLFLPPPPCRACRYGPGPMTGMGEVEGSDAYHGPDDLLPPESLVTHGTVPTRQLRHKRSCYIMPGTWSLNWGDDAGRPPRPAALARRLPRDAAFPRERPAMLSIFDIMLDVFYIGRVKVLLHDRVRRVSYEEKGTWVYLVTSAGAYAVYLAIILGRVASTPAAQVPYIAVLLWTAGASMVANMAGRILVETASPSDSRRADVRDRDVSRFGEHASRWFLVAGAAAALVMAMAKVDYFWIANVIYLGFVLWAVVGSAIKLVAYRRGLSPSS